MSRETEYRNALLWVFDRLSVDRMTPSEIRRTMFEVGNVLQRRPSPAARYQPEEWDESRSLVPPPAAESRAGEVERLLAYLTEISQGKGRFSLDHHEHARNTIEDMKQLALDAMTGKALNDG